MTPRSSILQGLVALCLAAQMFVPLYFSSSTIFPFVVIKATASHVSIYCLCVLAAVAFWQKKDKLEWSGLGFALVAFVVIQFCASMFGANPERSMFSTFERSQGIVSLLVWTLLAFSVASLFRTESSWRLLLQGLVLAGCVVSFAALLFVVGAFDAPYLLRDFGRLAFTVGNSAVFGNYLGIIASLAFGFLLLDFRHVATSRSVIEAVQLGLLLFCLIATGSRGGVLAFIVCAALLLVLAPLPRKEKFIVIAVVTGFGLLGSILLWDIVNARVSVTSLDSDSIGYRLQAWQIGWAAFLAKPFLGWGPENFIQIFGQYAEIKQIANETFDTAHNHLVAILVGSGLVGLLSYVSMVGLALFSLWQRFRSEQSEAKNNALLVLTLIVSYQATSLFLFESLVTAPLFFLSIAYCLRVSKVRWHVPSVVGVPLLGLSVLLLIGGVVFESKVLHAAQQLRTVEADTKWQEKFAAAEELSGQLRHEELVYFFALETWSNWESLDQSEKVKSKQQLETLLGDSDIVALSWRTMLHVSRVYLLFVQAGANNLSELQMLVERTNRLAPNRPQSHRLLANYFLLIDQPDQAKAVLEQYLAVDPDRPVMREMLARLTSL